MRVFGSLIFLCAIALLGPCGVDARTSQVYPFLRGFVFDEGINFPYYEAFNVSDHQSQRWILQIDRDDMYFSTILRTGKEPVNISSIEGHLYDTQSQNSYIFGARGSLTPENYRISPDLKWASLSNIFMQGESSHYELIFNVTISYADFWSDSPANNLYSLRQIEYSDDESDDDCEKESKIDSGFNYPKSQGFWLNFDFNDGSHLYFNIPHLTHSFILMIAFIN